MTTDKSRADALTTTKLPDGSGFAVASLPLPQDHWLYAPRCAEWDSERNTSADTPRPILTHAQRDAVTAAVRYAIRGATMCGKESDFDPDAIVLNAVYALCGPFSSLLEDNAASPVQQPAAAPEPCAHDYVRSDAVCTECGEKTAAAPKFDKAKMMASAREHGMDLGDNPVAYEFYNKTTGHAIVDYTRWTHRGHLTEKDGYEARPLVYATQQPAAAPIATHWVETEWPVKQIGVPHLSDKPTIMTCAPASEPVETCACGYSVESSCNVLDPTCKRQAAPADERAAFAEVRFELETIRDGASHWRGMPGGWSGTTAACNRALDALARISANETVAEGAKPCKTCGGSRVVDDGEITGSGEVEFENGPIKCVKDCPDCTAPAQAAEPVAQWQYSVLTPGYEGDWHNCNAETAQRLQQPDLADFHKVRALYAAPQLPAQADAREGLTDEGSTPLLAAVEWCIENGNCGPRTRATLVAVRALLKGADHAE